MANPGHIATLKQGIKIWNKWRKNNPAIIPDLRGGDLNGADLSKADLNGADLSKADFREANLREADLRGAGVKWANLSKADLSGATLIWANLSGATLRRAILNGADLSKADLSGTDLSKADFSKADLMEANLREADLRGAILNGADLSKADLSRTDLSGAIINENTLLRTRNIKGSAQIGVNGIWSKHTDSAALMTIIPPGNSMKGPNPDSIIEILKRARRIHGFSLSLVGIILLMAAFNLQQIKFPYSDDITVSAEQFGGLAMPMSIVLIFLVNIFLNDALHSMRFLNDRSSAMSVGNFPWIVSKYIGRLDTDLTLRNTTMFFNSILFSYIPRFILCFHGAFYIYYLRKWEIYSYPLYVVLSALLVLVSTWTFILSQKLQKPIIFDSRTEMKRQSDIAKLTIAIEKQTESFKKIADLLNNKKNDEDSNAGSNDP